MNQFIILYYSGTVKGEDYAAPEGAAAICIPAGMRDISLRDAICKKRDMCLRHVKRNAYHIAREHSEAYIAFAKQIYRIERSEIYRAARQHIAHENFTLYLYYNLCYYSILEANNR